MAHLDIGQLVQRILADIQVGKLADGQRKLPAEPVLMERYQVTRYTLRQALKQLSNMVILIKCMVSEHSSDSNRLIIQ